MPGLKAFVAAVFGGIGNVPGAMLGGILARARRGDAWRATPSPRFRDGIAFAILILILLVRPEGLLGRVTVEKV